MAKIRVNGDEKEIEAGISLEHLLHRLDIDPAKVAVEHNRVIASKGSYGDIVVRDGDALEIVHFIGGG